jgi:Ca2+-binding RTX toxin-like protein
VCVAFDDADQPITVNLARGSARGQGNDRLRGVRCVYGSPHADDITGTNQDDYLDDFAGGGKVRALGGDDFVNGSTGHDVAYLGPGDDTFAGYEGDDLSFGGPGRDRLSGFAGIDSLHGGAGADRLFGSFDCFFTSSGTPGDQSPNDLHGGRGDDLLVGDLGNDLLDGGPGTDRGFGMEDGRSDTLVSLEQPRPDTCRLTRTAY